MSGITLQNMRLIKELLEALAVLLVAQLQDCRNAEYSNLFLVAPKLNDDGDLVVNYSLRVDYKDRQGMGLVEVRYWGTVTINYDPKCILKPHFEKGTWDYFGNYGDIYPHTFFSNAYTDEAIQKKALEIAELIF